MMLPLMYAPERVVIPNYVEPAPRGYTDTGSNLWYNLWLARVLALDSSRSNRVEPSSQQTEYLIMTVTTAAALIMTMIVSSVGAMALSLGSSSSSFTNNASIHHHHHHPRSNNGILLPCRQLPSSTIILSHARHSHSISTQLHAAKGTKNEKEPATQLDLTTLRKLVSQSTELHSKNLASTISYDQLQSRLSDLETESSDPTFWDASNSARNEVVTRDISRYAKLKAEMELWHTLKDDAVGALELLQELLLVDNNDSSSSSSTTDSSVEEDEEMIALTMEECQYSASQLLELSQKYELTTLLSGPYDASNCRLVLTAGAGGTEACDWVSMLYRMYSRHANYMDMKLTTLDESAGDVVGYKSVELLVEGSNNPYGWFKGEKGAHRLVRLSPFNANNKRQTTFAGVDVIPVLDDGEVKEIDIPEKELEVSTMRSGGAGGQNVNKVETGVRIKHIPSGIAVKCTQERSQLMNKQLALSRLKAQLLAIAQEQQLQSLNDIRGDIVEASWGAQIRNYVMQPYKMVKDARSAYETSDVDGVLGGGKALEEFIGAWLRWMRMKEEKEREEMELEV